MSIKIYDAWRIPRSKINEFTALAREATWAYLLKRIDGWMATVKDEAVQHILDEEHAARMQWFEGKEVPEWAKAPDEITTAHRWRLLEKMIVAASTKPERHLLDSDASFNFWIHGKYAYIIPYGKMVLPAEQPPWTEDYSYWNNTDRPDDVTARQWSARGRMWNRVCLDDWNKGRYHHTISEFDRELSHSGTKVEFHLGLWAGTTREDAA